MSLHGLPLTWVDLAIDLAILALLVGIILSVAQIVGPAARRRGGGGVGRGGATFRPEAWAARIPQRDPDDPDPITQLVDALELDGKPPLAWVIKWSEGGRCDPVFAAWQDSTDVWAMQRLLRLAGWPDDEIEARYNAAVGADPTEMLPDAFRRVVPVPPPLAELLTAAASGVPPF